MCRRELAGVETLAARGAVSGEFIAVIAGHSAADFGFGIGRLDDLGDRIVRDFDFLRRGRSREQKRYQHG